MMRLLLVLAVALVAFGSVPDASAQVPSTGGSTSSSSSSTPTIPEGAALTEEAVRNVLSGLSDEQARKLLLDRLTEEAKAEQAKLAAAQQTTVGEEVSEVVENFGKLQVDVLQKVPAIPSAIGQAFSNFAEARGDAGAWRFAFGLIASLAAGAAAALIVGRLIGRNSAASKGAEHPSLFVRLRALALRFFVQIVDVIAFAIVAYGISSWVNASVPADQETVNDIIEATASVLFVLAAARFALAPAAHNLRLVSISDSDARWLTGRIVILAVIFSFGFAFTYWMAMFGVPWHVARIAYWVNLAFYLVLILSIWQGRHIITQMLLEDPEPAPAAPVPAVSAAQTTPDDGSVLVVVDEGDDAEDDEFGSVPPPHAPVVARPAPSPARQWIAKAWPKIGIGLVIAQYLLVLVVAANVSDSDDLANAMVITLFVLLGLPFLDRSMQAIVAGLLPESGDRPPAIRAANAASRGSYRRISRVIGLSVLFVLLLSIWGVDLLALAHEGVGARFADALVDVLLIAALGYVAWEAVNIIVDRQIAREQAERGVDPSAGGHMEGEGGGEGARLGTILPLLRIAIQVGIAVLTVLVIFGEFGVNVTPLLAGAGVIGLAIGFGAQTLVKDIVSGVFFLIDDAFRKGEYIDLGSVKGVVEKISIRSMQLRHHRGILNTVPFGEIRNVANMSRDWVVMKFPLRVPYGTDPEKVRKMIKKLGQQLLDHPEYGKQFLEPLKCQGVVEMEDSYMMMPVKYMSRPGEQWALRRLVLTEIQKLFSENNIKFAHREVSVRVLEDPNRPLTDEERAGVAGSAARRLMDEEQAAGKAAQ